jgi:hypothetical protein
MLAAPAAAYLLLMLHMHCAVPADIVEIKHIMLPPSPRDFKDIYVVFELMETDLHQVRSLCKHGLQTCLQEQHQPSQQNRWTGISSRPALYGNATASQQVLDVTSSAVLQLSGIMAPGILQVAS